jgi:hypothetical protein
MIGTLATEADLRRFIESQLAHPGTLPKPRHPISLFKAGAITDADFAATPPDGAMGVDTTNLRLYVRVAGTWRYAGLT